MSIDKFKTILATNAFDQLTPYTQPHAWNDMSTPERELLGILFVKQGEHQITNGDSKVLESFELASQVAPDSPVVFYRQALVYAAQEQNIRCLLAAKKALEKTLHLDPTHFGAWHSLANVLVKIGLFNDDITYFYQADEKFHEAEHLAKHQHNPVDATLYWHWGVCWYHMGKHSGEAVDFFRALEKFRLAEQQGCDEGGFHNDYGNVLVDLALLVTNRKELFLEAIDHYLCFNRKSLKHYEGWLNLAFTYQRLFELTHLSDYFHEAKECFEMASELNPEEPLIWWRWGELLAKWGKFSQDIDWIHASFEKFERAAALDPDHPQILLRWGEAQMLSGAYLEDLDLLRDAKAKIKIALESVPQEASAWYIYGSCLYELGHYFHSEDYYYQAIDKFQFGLTLKSNHPLLIQGLASAYFSIGEISSSPSMLEKAIEFYARYAELGEPIPSQLLNDWGVCYMKLGEITGDQSSIEAAAEKFEQAINNRLEKNHEDIDSEWLYNYGCAMDFLGDFHEEPIYYEKAVQVLFHVIQIEPNFPHVRYNLALALLHLGELNDDIDVLYRSVEVFHDLVQHEPEDDMAWNEYGVALLTLAVLLKDPSHATQAQDLFAQAESKFLHAMALGNVAVYYNLACLYALTGNLSGALHYLEKGEQHDSLPHAEDVIHDEWLESLRHQPGFRALISRLLNKDED